MDIRLQAETGAGMEDHLFDRRQRLNHFRVKTILFSLVTIVFVISASSSMDSANGNEAKSAIRSFLREFITRNATTIGNSTQLIFVTNRDASSFSVGIDFLEKNGGLWKIVFPRVNATIGEKGFASLNKKKEGDRRSPTGIFRLGTAFGYGPSVATKMPYRQATEEDFWVDDVDSEDYNKWVRGPPKAASAEKMKREDGLYKYGIVIEYNTDPVIKGRGSAIFLHRWGGRGRPTLGCVATPEGNVLRLLEWLDPAKKPLIILGTEAELRTLRSQ